MQCVPSQWLLEYGITRVEDLHLLIEDQIRTRNILKALIMTNGQNTIIAPLIDMYRVKFGTKNFRLRVLRDTG